MKITREGGPSAGAPPAGAMARAPAQLKLSRGPRGPGNASVGARRGPNLRGRDRKPGGSGSGSREQGPKKRDRKDGDDAGKPMDAGNIKMEQVLNDGMVQQLLRLQRSEWDRKPYEPKYAPGSFAANQLIHAGRELFRGEAPPVKRWGMLEKRIGVVGMHNAEGRLEVRRVVDTDSESLGERREYFETGDVDIQVKAKAPQTKAKAPAAAPAAKAPAKKAQVAQAAATKVPAPKPAAVV